jgi:dipeptidyl aminopeptidase/acylaminoacyl peptidase
VVITRYLYKPTASEGMTRFNDNRRLHIFVVDIASKQARQLTDGTYYEHSIDWSPKGDEILFVSNHEDDPDLRFNYDVFAVRVADKSIRRVTNTENVEYKPTWSPDGRTIAYLGTKRGLTSSETTMEDTHVWLMDADGGNRRELGAAIDNRQGAPEWSKDGRFIYYTLQEHGSTHLYRMSAAGGTPELIVGGQGRLGGWSLGPNGVVVYAFSTPRDMDQLFVKNAGAVRQMTDVNRDVLGSHQIADVEAFTFRSFDGMEVEAFVTKPIGLNPADKYPLIAVIHGGPHGQQGPEFQFKNQVYAAHGMASIMINYRGSTGYGQRFADAIFGDQDGGEAKDVMTGVDAALRRYPWIDPKRLGVEGGSYGGQLSDWIVTQSNRFAAAIPIASISNLVSFNYMSYYHDYLAVEFGAFPHQEKLMDKLWERSALRYVAQVRTPVMLVHGENDNDVPIAEAEQFFIALKDVGVETVMVRYPREGHGVREVGHTIDLLDRSMAWYDRHFGKAPTRPVSSTSDGR